MNDLNDLVLNTRQVVTFNNYGLLVTNGQIRVLQQGPTANVTHTDSPIAFWDASNTLSSVNLSANLTASPFFFGSPLDWTAVLGTYGNVRPGVSQIGLSYDYSINEIFGTITVDPTDPTILLYNANVATLPANTLPAIISIVNPEQVAPGYGLSNANIGDSYLLTSSIGSAWPYDTGNSSATANVNDIITYSGNSWVSTFSAENNIGNISFVYDNTTNLQCQWNGNVWVRGYEGDRKSVV